MSSSMSSRVSAGHYRLRVYASNVKCGLFGVLDIDGKFHINDVNNRTFLCADIFFHPIVKAPENGD